MFLHVLWRAMRQRRQRIGLALAALTVSATLAAALLSFYADIEGKLRREFRGYGANLVVAPAGDGETIPLAALGEAEKYGEAAPFLYSVQPVHGELVVLAGVDFRRLGPLSGYWRVQGRSSPLPGECLIGEQVAERFRLRPGSEIEAAGERRRVAGIVSTGGAEDSQVLLPIGELAQHTGLAGQASLIALRADGAQIHQVRAKLAAAVSGAEVRLLRAIAESEARVALKIRGTMLLLTLVILLISSLCVMNNFAAIVYQRRQEIGILKAIGAADRQIILLFAGEALTVGALGSLAGFAAGAWLARWLGWQIFRQPVAARWEVLPLVAGLTLAIALAAAVLPIREIRRIEPAVILRGD